MNKCQEEYAKAVAGSPATPHAAMAYFWRAAWAARGKADAEIAAHHYIPGHLVAGPHFAAVCADKIKELDHE